MKVIHSLSLHSWLVQCPKDVFTDLVSEISAYQTPGRSGTVHGLHDWLHSLLTEQTQRVVYAGGLSLSMLHGVQTFTEWVVL